MNGIGTLKTENIGLIPNGNGAEKEDGKNGLEKARIRTLQEGYKYRTLDETNAKENEQTEKKRKNSMTKTYQKYQRFICYGIILAVIVLAVVISVLLWFHIRYKHKVCDSPTCTEASAYIVGKMNLTADPCNNFYNYVCGSWLKNLQVPKSRAKYNVFSMLSDENDAHLKKIIEDSSFTLKGNYSSAVKKVKKFYNLCMNEQQIEDLGTAPVLELIKDLGSWTVTSNPEAGVTWNNDSWDFFQTLFKFNSYSSAPLFYFGVTTDDKNSSNKIGFFDQSGLTLNDREDYVKNHTGYDKLHEAYIKFAVEVAKLLGNNDTADVRQKMEAVFQLETKLAEIHVPKEKMLDPEKNYHKMTLKDLQQITGNAINLTVYMSHVVGKPIQQMEQVIVYTPDYFRKIGAVITNTEKSVMANYFVWHFISGLTGYFPKPFLDAAMILNEAERGITTMDPRWQRCMSKAQGNFGYVFSALYVQDHFSESSRQKVQEIAQGVRDAFIRNLPNVGWMDEKTKATAMDKAKAMDFKIGYPDWIMDQAKLDKFYENVTNLDGQFLKTKLGILKTFHKKSMRNLGKPPNPDEWGMKPVEVNAFYTPSYNYLAFMAGILQQPFYSKTFPKSFNFGTTGMIAGHEMTHGFDNTGRHYDKHGNLENWWSNSSAKNFEEKSKCMIEQYSSYTEQGVHLKGDRILGENIADNGGVSFAYSAYRHWLQKNNKDNTVDYKGLENFTGDQLFYIGFGQLWCTYYTPTYAKQAILTDEHSISKFRTIGVVSNSHDFARAFKCKPGTAMNPEKKCKVW